MRAAFAFFALTLVAGCGRMGFERTPMSNAAGVSGGGAGAGGGGSGGGAGGLPTGGAIGTGGIAATGSVAGTGGVAGRGGVAGMGGMAGMAGGGAGMGGTGAAGGGGTGGITVVDGGPDAGTVCPTSTFGGHLYAFCSTLSSWADADADCATKGMRLVRIDDASENAWVQATAYAGITAISSIYWSWIGATDQAVLGQWTWTDGALFWSGGSNGAAQGGLYNNWVGGSPGNNGSAGRCGIFQHFGYWQDWDCTSLQSYVCEQD